MNYDSSNKELNILIDKSKSVINNYDLIPKNNFFEKKNQKENDIEIYKKEVKEVMNHFSSISFISGEIKVEDFINSAAYLSHIIKKINLMEKVNYPDKFYDSKNIIKYPGLISPKFGEDEQLFILSLISKILSEKGINVTIYKKNQGENNLDGACLQYLFNGFTEKKKYEIQFDLEKEKNDILLKKEMN